MRKRVTLLERKAGMSPERFRAHWRGPHAEIVARLPGLRGYTQNHVVCDHRRDGVAPLAGIVEVWFEPNGPDTRFSSHFSSAQLADEPTFLDGLVGVTLGDVPYACAAASVWVLGPRSATLDPAAVLTDVPVEFAWAGAVDAAAGTMTRQSLPHRLPTPDAVATIGLADVTAARRAFDEAVSAWGATHRVLLCEAEAVVVPTPEWPGPR